MKPTEDLKNEHAAVKLALKILAETARRLEEGVGVEEDHLGGLLEFLRVFVDRCHHGKEEDLLFPAMERAGVPREGGPLGVMLAEHKEGRTYVKAMGAAFLEYRKGGKTAGREYAQNARGYASLLARHIEKEDNVLYPLAESRLPAGVWKELEAGFEKIEDEVVRAGRHEEFHALLHRLKEEYLPQKGGLK